MASRTSAAASLDLQGNAAGVRVRSGYFFWMSALLLALVLVGFAPTLYLREFFPALPIPGYLYVHGIVLTAWFVWLVLQTALVRKGDTAAHRRMGVIGSVIGACVVLVGPLATLGVVGRLRAAGLDWDSDISALPFLGVQGVPMVQFAAQVVWVNLLSILVFAGLLVAAVLLRRSPQAHKRLMLLGSIVIVAPALARISRWPIIGGEDSGFIPIALFALLLSVVVHDLLVTRRVHRATWIGIAVVVAGTIAQQAIARSALGLEFVRSLG
ncbi:MAG TPA: hypothetical protein VHH11_11105 [Gammaproteobacteria bacterium]|nr:hypothetical protein [Gammaproteobacteria bacterium]